MSCSPSRGGRGTGLAGFVELGSRKFAFGFAATGDSGLSGTGIVALKKGLLGADEGSATGVAVGFDVVTAAPAIEFRDLCRGAFDLLGGFATGSQLTLQGAANLAGFSGNVGSLSKQLAPVGVGDFQLLFDPGMVVGQFLVAHDRTGKCTAVGDVIFTGFAQKGVAEGEGGFGTGGGGFRHFKSLPVSIDAVFDRV